MKKEKSVIAMKKGAEVVKVPVVPCGPEEYYKWAKEYVDIIGKQIATFKVKIYMIENYHLPRCVEEVRDPNDPTGKKVITQPDKQLIASYEAMKRDTEKQIDEFNYIYGIALEKIKEWEKLQKKK